MSRRNREILKRLGLKIKPENEFTMKVILSPFPQYSEQAEVQVEKWLPGRLTSVFICPLVSLASEWQTPRSLFDSLILW